MSLSPEKEVAWSGLMALLAEKSQPHQFETWLSTMRCLDIGPELVRVAVPKRFNKDWINKNYRDLILGAAEETLGASPNLEIEVQPDRSPGKTALQKDETSETKSDPTPSVDEQEAAPTDGQASPAAAEAVRPDRLNRIYIFDNFVVGPSNRLAHAAAQAVAESPARAYNPLFLHGDVGLGKTHLLQAVCHHILDQTPETVIQYLSCEAFTNHFIGAVRRGHIDEFRNRYRHADVLVVDDIHFLSKKERTQEEFFHTFNALYTAQKQIILSSDSHPANIRDIEDRLTSRFKWGLVAKIEPPAFETRIEILRAKARLRGTELPEPVLDLLASHMETNVRELEGAVTKIIGYATLEQREITLELAQEVFKHVLGKKPHSVPISEIQETVARKFGIKLGQLTGRSRTRSITHPRQIAMYMAFELTDLSLQEIGGFFGGRHHTTVLHAIDKVKNMKAEDPKLEGTLEDLHRELQG